MNYVTFDFLGQHRHGTALHQYLRLRKRFFVDDLGWDMSHNDDVEMDQYDNPCAHYVLVIRGSTVVGGARLVPTTASWGRHRYMLRDICGTRSISHRASSRRRSRRTRSGRSRGWWFRTDLAHNGGALRWTACRSSFGRRSSLVRQHGGQELISLSPVPLARTLRQLGFPVRRVGEPYCESDGRRYAMLRMPALAPPD